MEGTVQGCQILLGAENENEENIIPKENKIFHKTTKYTKC
jgi:hypothetical protein